VLAGLASERTDPGQVLVGFAAETPDAEHSLLDLGRAKLQRKGCDLLVLNEVGRGLVFGQPDSAITLLSTTGVGPTITGSKDTLAHRIWDAALGLRLAR
jgi:phosphopantothenoylcysteine decarboxylase / phosphopantothenate---cysteine ligase